MVTLCLRLYSTIVNLSHLDAVLREMNNIDILNFIELNIQQGDEGRSAWTVRELHCRLAEYLAHNIISYNSITDANFMETLDEFIYRLLNSVLVVEQQITMPELILGPTQISARDMHDSRISLSLRDYTKVIKFETLENIFNRIVITGSYDHDNDLPLIKDFFEWLRHVFLVNNSYSVNMYIDRLYEFLVNLNLEEQEIGRSFLVELT
ncbi:hypothetical protein ROZALSC1DRAFT_22205 [Rozella allomycis CSF55]|uniref:Uncharacterized protein n=1 Tax=Rozella allomycis (strain CSF55) TaxID=988480 RepID=A0A4P9YJG4_ROZAC|nr:hypothetical protein ROZALSC1DRAFT_22205 [Rozella allomycis CSF55]